MMIVTICTTHPLVGSEGLNVADMLTADHVSRMAVYYSADNKSEASYDITGSYFENLRIAGHKIDVNSRLTFSTTTIPIPKWPRPTKEPETDDWLVGSKMRHLEDSKLEDLEKTYHALSGMSGLVNQCRKKTKRAEDQGSYWFSAPNHLRFKQRHWHVRTPGLWLNYLYSQIRGHSSCGNDFTPPCAGLRMFG